MNGRTDVRTRHRDVPRPRIVVGSHSRSWIIGAAQPSDAAAAVMEELTQLTGPTLVVMVVGVAVRGVSRGRRRARNRDRRLGRSGRAARGQRRAARPDLRLHPARRRGRRRGPRRDRRRLAGTALRRRRADEPTGEPAPLDLYERYLQQRRLAVPVAAGAWGLMLVFGLAGFLALAFRERVSPRCSPWPGRSRFAAVARPRAPARRSPSLALVHEPWSRSSSYSCRRCRVHSVGRRAPKHLRRAGGVWCGHPGDPRRGSGARLAGGRDPARGRRAARRRALLRDAEHRDRHRARVGPVPRASHARGQRRAPPRGVRARGRLAVDRREFRRRDHPLRRSRHVARDPASPALVDGRPHHGARSRPSAWPRSR